MQKENNIHKFSFIGNSLYLFAAKFFPALATLLVWMHFSKELSIEQYGHYQSYWIQLATLMGIATIGFPIFVLTYSAAQAMAILRSLKRKEIFIYIFFISALATLFVALQSNENQLSIWLPALFFILYTAVLLSDSLLINFRSFLAVTIINLVYAIVFVAVHIWIMGKGYDLEALLKALLILLFVRLLANLFFIKLKAKTIVTGDIAEGEWKKIKKLWLQLGINDVVQVLFRWGDKFILSFLLAKELFAVYTNATIEIAFLPLIFSAVSSAAVQHWAHQQATKTVNDQINLLLYSARILSSIVFPLFFFLLFFREEFLMTIFSEKYISGVWIFVCAQLVLPVRAYPFTALLQSHHRGDLINKGSILDFILAIALMYPLYLIMGLPGVALAFVISTYWQAGYYLIQSARLLQLPALHLIPLSLLLRKFLIFAVLFGTAYFIFSTLFSSTASVFWAGIFLLFLSGGASLLREWNKNTKPDERTA